MTEPRDPNQWPAQHSGPNNQGQPVQPQGPATGPTVSYNAAAFDDEDPAHPADPADPDGSSAASSEQPAPSAPGVGGPTSGSLPHQSAQSGSFGVPNPQSGSFGVPNPQSGSFGVPNPQSGGFGVPNPQSGGFAQPHGPASGAFGQPGPDSGAFGQPPTAASGGYPPQFGGPATGPHAIAYPPTGPGGTAARPGRGKKKPLLLGLGALVVVGLLVVGYFVFLAFPGIENSRGAIKNAKGFVSTATATWQSSLPEEGITVGKDAGCYYVLNDKDEITNQLACGPALRAGSEKGAVWDYYHFEVDGNGDNQQAKDLSEEPEVGQPAPDNGSIVDVDGNEPDDGSNLEEPPLPKAEEHGVWMADAFAVDEASKGNAVELGADPRLVSPGVQVVVSSITEYSVATIEGQPAQAADGQKLFVITLTGDAGPVSGSLPTTLDFDLNGTQVSGSSSPATLGETQILVSVPSSGKSNLVLNSDGHQQMLNLADGERAQDATTELFYTGTPEPSVTLTEVINFPPTSITATEAFALNIAFVSARMTPHDEVYGWAPAGQHWLVVEMTTDGVTSAEVSSFQYYAIDCTTSTVNGGTTKSCESDPGGSQTATWVVAVTPGTKSFSGNFIATMNAWGDAQADAFGGFGPAPVSISFP